MLSLKVIDTDEFLDMPQSSQYLYLNLSLRADDDGFISNPKKIMRYVNCNEDDMKVLIAKRFVIPFESGVCVIRHWRIHNLIRSDRYIETEYKDEKEQLLIKNGKYEHSNGNVIPNDNQMDAQVRLGKVRLGKVNVPESESEIIKFTPEDIKMVELFMELIKQNNPAWKNKSKPEKWAEDINKLHRIDNRTYEQIEYMIRWVQKDDFWSRNILSASKLREKFNDLIPKLKAKQGKSRGWI